MTCTYGGMMETNGENVRFHPWWCYQDDDLFSKAKVSFVRTKHF